MDRRYYSSSNKKNNKYIHKIVNHYNPKNTVQICFTSYKEGEELKGEKKSIRKYMFQDSDGNVEDYGLEKYKIDLEYIENKYYNNDELTRREKIFLMFKESNREKLKEILKKQGVKMETEASHGGMETGILKGLIPDLDIITYGPIAQGCHTPEEKLNLESFQKAYKNLCDLIAEL